MKNEPAFPFAFTDEARVSDGMTLRDYFAGQAMQGLIARYSSPETIANVAYHMADAMLKARQA